MQCFSELVTPTIVTHSLSIPFLNSKAHNLIVVRTSLLQVFNVNPVNTKDILTHGRLSLIGEYTLSGTVTSLARIKVLDSQSGGEAILVSFKDAKVSLLEWDPSNYRISTISIHYYENGKINFAPFEPALSDNNGYLRADPRSRCAALRIGSKHLAIIPFRQADDDLVHIESRSHNLNGTASSNGTPLPNRTSTSNDVDNTSSMIQTRPTPYSSSFVLPITALDPSLSHPIDLAFLYEYREPTFGIISAQKNVSAPLLAERKDLVNYTVITLDLEQRASTTLLAVRGLPYDIWKIVPLPLPIGGSVLVGYNELIYIDQSGKINAVAVNGFAKQCSGFAMMDQSDLQLRLEDSCIQSLNPDTGDMLIILADGNLAILSFKVDGRTVSGLSINRVSKDNGGDLGSCLPTSVSYLGQNHIFIGSDAGDSEVLSWSVKVTQSARKRSHAEMLGENIGIELDESDLEDADLDADDDLYADEPTTKASSRAVQAVEAGDYVFVVSTYLPSLGPINSMVLGENSYATGVGERTEMMAVVGRGKASKLMTIGYEMKAVMQIERPNVDIEAVFGFDVACDDSVRRYIVSSEQLEDGRQVSHLMQIACESLATCPEDSPWPEHTASDFDNDGRTINIEVMKKYKQIIQVRETDIVTYDYNFGLSQILPFPEGLQIIHSSICEPYVLLLSNDSTLHLLEARGTGDLEESNDIPMFTDSKWLSGCLYRPANSKDEVLCCLLRDDGALVTHDVRDPQQTSYISTALSALPAILTTEDRKRRAATRETLSEIILADIGQEDYVVPHLVVRTSTDEIIMYELFHHVDKNTRIENTSFLHGLMFRKVSNLHLPRYTGQAEMAPPSAMQVIKKHRGYTAIFIPGDSPSFIIKTAITLPRIIPLKANAIRSLTTDGEYMIYVDYDRRLIHANYSEYEKYDISGCVYTRQYWFPQPTTIHKIAYHSEKGLYVLLTSEMIPGKSNGDDGDSSLLSPVQEVFSIRLFHHAPWEMIDTITLPYSEIVTSLLISSLETSELTFAKQQLITVGTVTNINDQYADKGYIYTFDLIYCVPSPSLPQSNIKFKLLSREETRAGITALCSISSSLLLTGQGQKLMIRGLREDHQNLPVAFIDLTSYTTCIKSLPGNGPSSRLFLSTDVRKGLCVGGFNTEPPRINIFARSPAPSSSSTFNNIVSEGGRRNGISTDGGFVTAEFLPFQDSLYILALDGEGILSIMQFDPEHPKSMAGSRLIFKSSFNLGGHDVKGMMLLPCRSTLLGDPDEVQEWRVLTYSSAGQIGLVTPLDEATYRRLSALQTHLINVLEHPAGLNPKAYRNVMSEDGGGRGMLDGDIIRRIGELGAGKRSESVGRVSQNGWWEIKSDVELIRGRGLDYF